MTDHALAATSREVVMWVDQPDGSVEITKVRAASVTGAERLADALDARADVVAQTNAAIAPPTVPEPNTVPAPAKPRAGGAVRLGATGSAGPAAVRTAGSPTSAAFGVDQWGLSAVGAPGAWSITRGRGFTVAVIDTGVDASHPDLVGRILPQVNIAGGRTPGDLSAEGHGTHVAGIIAATLDNTGVAGVANEVRVLPVRVFGTDGWADAYTVARGITAAVDAGARVINLSLGSPQDSAVEARAVQYAIERGVTVVAAAGNEYEAGNPVTYPAAYPGVIGVSSINALGESSWFANTGSYVDIAAPGESIWSTVPGGGWLPLDGTSMAAPFVAATAALVRVANPWLQRSAVERVLFTTAADDANCPGWDTWFGHGLVRSDLAVTRAASAVGGLRAPRSTVKVAAVSGASRLAVDVGPDRVAGAWRFQVQRREGTRWVAWQSSSTLGSTRTRTVDPPRGTYRVVVPAAYGYRSGTSAFVTLAR